jgi:trans-2-enoyl-CoA reductase
MSNKITKQLLEDIVKNVVKDTIKEELKPIKLLVYSLLKEQVSSKKNKQELTSLLLKIKFHQKKKQN